MNTLSGPSARLAASGLGIATHLLVLRVGEWDLETVRLLGSFVALHGVAIGALVKLAPENSLSIVEAARLVGSLGLSFWSGVLGSMLVYRGFFHRLQRFPGPFLARFSNLYATYLSAKNLHLYEEVAQLHERYGNIVRLGKFLRCARCVVKWLTPKTPRTLRTLH